MSKRTALIAAGVVLAAGGGVTAVAGGATLAIAGTDGTLSTGQHAVSSDTAALVSEKADTYDVDSADVGHPSLDLSITHSDRPVFVGVGPAAAVDRYLAGASVETVDDIETGPFHLETTVRSGTAQLAAPVDQDFWVAHSTGATSAATTWHLHDGKYRVVVMNADGTPGIHADGKFGLHVPWLAPVAFTALGGGAAVLLAGLTILVLGLRNEPEPAPVDSPSPYVTVGL
jgi:hypothetical protein